MMTGYYMRATKTQKLVSGHAHNSLSAHNSCLTQFSVKLIASSLNIAKAERFLMLEVQ